MNEDRLKEKLQLSMEFESSDLWDSIHYVIDSSVKAELASAVSQGIDETKRAHQCGRVESLMYFKELLNETRQMARKNSGRSS